MLKIPEIYPDPQYIANIMYSSSIPTSDYIGDFDRYLNNIFNIVKNNKTLADTSVNHLVMYYAINDPNYAFFLLTSQFLWDNYSYFNQYIPILVNVTIEHVNDQTFINFRSSDYISRSNRLGNLIMHFAKRYFPEPSSDQLNIPYLISNLDIILNNIFKIFKADVSTISSDSYLVESFNVGLLETLNYEIPLPDYEYEDDDSLFTILGDVFIIVFDNLYSLLKRYKDTTPSFTLLTNTIYNEIILNLNTVNYGHELKNHPYFTTFLDYNYLDIKSLHPLYDYVLNNYLPTYQNLTDNEKLYTEFIMHLCYIMILNLGSEITSVIDLVDSTKFPQHIQNFVMLIKNTMGVI